MSEGGATAPALGAINNARAAARAIAWGLAGADAPDHHADAKNPVVIDLDATLITAHSDKESAAKTWKKGYGFHPLCAFVNHGTDGTDGTGEPLVIKLRTGKAGANTAADHIAVTKQALAQLPSHRPGVRPPPSPLSGSFLRFHCSAPVGPVTTRSCTR